MELFSIIFTVLTTGLVFAISLYGFDRIWLKQHHGDIPSTEDSSITTSIRNGNQQVKSFRELIKVFGPILWEFDTKYWIKNIGLDGYSYLYFQREMLKMFILFGISSSAVLIPFKIWSSIKLSNLSSEHGDDIDTVYYINEMSSILNCLLVYFFSIYCIFTMFKIKRHVRGQLVLKHHNKTEHNEWEKLNAQSVHVRGMFPEDRRAELLMAEIEAFLEYKGGGRVLSLKVIPDFVEIVDLENERREVDDAHKLYTANEPAVRRMCFPSKYRNEEYYEKRIKDIDDEVNAIFLEVIGQDRKSYYETSAVIWTCFCLL
jgi:hypothetical protein